MVNILIVDDDKNIRKLLQVVLERQGFNVHLASDGLEALRVIDQVKIDLAIVDIMMPNIDGYEFTKTLRDGNADLSVLMISAKDMVEDRKKGFMVGIDDYMTKPIDIEEFLLHVKALLRRAKINDEKKIIIGDVVVDSDSLTVTKNGETQVLPQKEFLLLFKLLSYPDKIFTRIQLMDEIWGMDCDTGWETVTVHIARLRKRFEGWQEFEIQSIRGLGYKVVKSK
ncbi:MAG: response regulator transcription factor [Clostridiales bacterium]|nr:response regulator transcription factor [Clostridiales bacterium]